MLSGVLQRICDEKDVGFNFAFVVANRHEPRSGGVAQGLAAEVQLMMGDYG